MITAISKASSSSLALTATTRLDSKAVFQSTAVSRTQSSAKVPDFPRVVSCSSPLRSTNGLEMKDLASTSGALLSGFDPRLPDQAQSSLPREMSSILFEEKMGSSMSKRHRPKMQGFQASLLAEQLRGQQQLQKPWIRSSWAHSILDGSGRDSVVEIDCCHRG